MTHATDLIKSAEERKIKEYQKCIAGATTKVLDLLVEEGIDSFGKAMDVVNTVKTSVERMMYSSEFKKPEAKK